MRILFLGDVVGRAARTILIEQLGAMINAYGADFTVVNGENAAGGYGITPEIARDLLAAGADVITTGNHVWDQRAIIGAIASETRLLRPENFPPGTPGRGFVVRPARNGRQVLVLNVMGRLFMEALDDPFAAADRVLQNYVPGQRVAAAIVDFHGEATSEKMAFGHYVDGRASFVVGTHTHVPTADYQVLPGGTAYLTDAGMCGDYDSVIGNKKDGPIQRFTTKMPGEKFSPALGEVTLCGAVVDIDETTGLARAIHPLRRGGRLAPIEPPPPPR